MIRNSTNEEKKTPILTTEQISELAISTYKEELISFLEKYGFWHHDDRIFCFTGDDWDVFAKFMRGEDIDNEKAFHKNFKRELRRV